MDWWSFQSKKLEPKPAYKRKVTDPRPTMEEARPPKNEPIEVEESDASDSMVLRILKSFRGD